VTDKDAYTTSEVGQICKVDDATVGLWVEQGKLRVNQTLGGARRIPKKDLVDFLKKNNIPLPPDLKKNGHVRILIVDDNDLLRHMMERMFLKTGWPHVLDSARDGFEAGQKILSFDPDLVVLDLTLPGMDGYQICERIQGLKRTPPMRVLAISGDMSPENRERVLRAGAADTLAKPFLLPELLEKLVTLCPALNKPHHA
jgi:excisionase family DNA binding protein